MFILGFQIDVSIKCDWVGFAPRRQVIAILKKGGYIAAIKFIRANRKWGLKKSREYVDRIIQDIGWE